VLRDPLCQQSNLQSALTAITARRFRLGSLTVPAVSADFDENLTPL